MNECTEEKCIVCDSYDTLISLLASGITLEEAHAITVEDIVDSVIDALEEEEALENEAYDQGFKDGVVEAMGYIHNFSGNVIKKTTQK